MAGCSSDKAAKDSKKAAAPDRIQGKAQVNLAETTANDLALNADGPSVYLVDGVRRYRLFFNKAAVTVDAGKEYVAEGVYAQRVIDDIGDPDQGKNGYPLQSSCDRVIRTAWPGLAFDVTDLHSSVLRARIKRYPARPIFLVTKLTPASSKEGSGGTAESKKNVEAEEDIPEITVPAEKQRALLAEGPTVQPAPLWEAAGGTAKCKVLIGGDGKIADLETGAQLCEAVPWSQFRFQPTVQKGHPVKVHSEVEVKFEPRKQL
jgi:hypothetical protein